MRRRLVSISESQLKALGRLRGTLEECLNHPDLTPEQEKVFKRDEAELQQRRLPNRGVVIAGSLFSGVGGLDLGLARAGYSHAFFAEVDPWRRDVLQAHWPGVPTYDDVAAVDQSAWPGGVGVGGGGLDARHRIGPDHEGRPGVPRPRLDLLAGGFPCQDLSVAGKRAGLDGARSGLFFEFARIIDALRPRWVLLENVPGLLSSNDGRDMGTVIGTLADLGYGVAWRILDARYFGVPQRRRRVFIVGHSGGDDRKAIRALCESCDGHPEASLCTWQGTTSSVGGRPAFALRRNPGGVGQGHNTNYIVNALDRQRGGPDDNSAQAGHLVVADTLTSGSHPGSNAPGRRREDDTNLVTAFHPTGGGAKGLSVSNDVYPTGVGAAGMPAISDAAGVRRLTPVECERLMSWPDSWTAPDGVKAPDSRRYAACGDGVVSNVSEWIGRRIMAASS